MSNILKRVDFVNKLRNAEPSTFNGKVMHDHFITKLSHTPLTNLFAGEIVNECLNSNDDGLKAFGSSMTKDIDSVGSTKFRFGMIMEMMEKSVDTNSMLKPIYESAKILDNMDNNELVESIKHGAIDNMLWYNPMKMLHESVAGRDNVKMNETVSVYVPVCYSEPSSKGLHFRVEGRDFVMNENEIAVSPAPSRKYIVVNEAVSSLPYDPINKEFFATTLIGEAVINESGELSVDGIVMPFEMFKESFQEALKDANMSQTKLGEQIKIADKLQNIYENHEGLMILDRVRVAKNEMINESIACIISGDLQYILENSKVGAKLMKAPSVKAATDRFAQKSGVNINEAFSEELLNESNRIAAELNEKNLLITGLNEKLDEVNQTLNESDPGSPRYEEMMKIKSQIEKNLEDLV